MDSGVTEKLTEEIKAFYTSEINKQFDMFKSCLKFLIFGITCLLIVFAVAFNKFMSNELTVICVNIAIYVIVILALSFYNIFWRKNYMKNLERDINILKLHPESSDAAEIVKYYQYFKKNETVEESEKTQWKNALKKKNFAMKILNNQETILILTLMFALFAIGIGLLLLHWIFILADPSGLGDVGERIRNWVFVNILFTLSNMLIAFKFKKYNI